MAAQDRFSTSIDLSEDIRTRMISLINQQMADTFDLYTQTKQAHWNVKGPQFFQLHELFDELAESIFQYVDRLAERATALGGVATGTCRMAAATSRLDEFPSGGVDGMQCVDELTRRFALVAASTRSAIDAADQANDQGTADIFIDMVQVLDKSLWFLEAHLQQIGGGRARVQRAA